MTTNDLKAILLAEHKRDLKLMWIGYAVIGGIALIILGFFLFLFIQLNVSFSGVASSMADEVGGSNVPAYVKIVFPVAILISLGYVFYAFMQLKKRPETINEFVKHVENGTRVLAINDTKNYRIKIPLYFVNYHTGAVQSFIVAFEGVNKGFSLPVPFAYTDAVKDLLNENS